MNSKPYAEACDRNKDAILNVLKEVVAPFNKKLLEIGSGTGQHAVFLAPHFKHLTWTTSDKADQVAGIKLWLNEFMVANIAGPLVLEIGKDHLPRQEYDLVFTANTFHIMPWKDCKTLIKSLGIHLKEGAQVIIYGPFNYEGKFTAKSNEEFDQWLKGRNVKSGIRSFEDVNRSFIKNGFLLCKDYEMPANNRTLVFTKIDRIIAS